MSKENAVEFFKLMVEKPELLDEAKKHADAENFYEALSKLAKEKNLECSAEEIEQAESMMSRMASGELDEADLESVAGGGWLGDMWKKTKNWFSENSYKFKEGWKGFKDGWSNAKKPEPAASTTASTTASPTIS